MASPPKRGIRLRVDPTPKHDAFVRAVAAHPNLQRVGINPENLTKGTDRFR